MIKLKKVSKRIIAVFSAVFVLFFAVFGFGMNNKKLASAGSFNAEYRLYMLDTSSDVFWDLSTQVVVLNSAFPCFFLLDSSNSSAVNWAKSLGFSNYSIPYYGNIVCVGYDLVFAYLSSTSSVSSQTIKTVSADNFVISYSSTFFMFYLGRPSYFTYFYFFSSPNSYLIKVFENVGAKVVAVDDVETNSYNNGYESGYESGYEEGLDEGLDEGKHMGYDLGYADGTADGRKQGYAEGKDVGYYEGYNAGVSTADNGSFFSLFSSLIDAPVSVFSSLLDFEILGFNMKTLALSLLCACLVVAVLRVFSGGL